MHPPNEHGGARPALLVLLLAVLGTTAAFSMLAQLHALQPGGAPALPYAGLLTLSILLFTLAYLCLTCGLGVWVLRTNTALKAAAHPPAAASGDRAAELDVPSDDRPPAADLMRALSTLHVVTRVARGVTHDLNNVFCAVSGHTALLQRGTHMTEDDHRSLQAIQDESIRGAGLATALTRRARGEAGAGAARGLEACVEEAARWLHTALRSGWLVRTEVLTRREDLTRTSAWMEEMLINLGTLAADQVEHAASVHLRVAPGGGEGLCTAGSSEDAIVLVAVTEHDHPFPAEAIVAESRDPASLGVVAGTLAAWLGERGGRLQYLIQGNGLPVFRVLLPGSGVEAAPLAEQDLPPELMERIRGWQMLLALDDQAEADAVEQYCREGGIQVDRLRDIVDILQRVQETDHYDAVVLDKQVLGNEAEGLLRAMLKLQPHAGFLVLCTTPEEVDESLVNDIHYTLADSRPRDVLEALVRARELAGRRGAVAEETAYTTPP